MAWDEIEAPKKKYKSSTKTMMPIYCILSGIILGIGIDLSLSTIIVPGIIAIVITLIAVLMYALDGDYSK